MTRTFACDEVARTFGTGRAAFVALHRVTCAADPGEQIALVGPSGSGKSTLLHLLAGLDLPTAGHLSWPNLPDDGRTGSGPWNPFCVGMVFQNDSLIPGLTALENVAAPLVFAGRRPAQAEGAAQSAMATLGLAHLEGRLPHELSGGQAQRVAVARVLATRPRLMLADEPTGRLDHDTATLVVDALLAVARDSGATLVLATHDEAVAARFERRWQMDDGALLTDLAAIGAAPSRAGGVR